MFRIVAVLCVLIDISALAAASRSKDSHKTGPPLSREEAQAFAIQFKNTIDLIAKQYTRPVGRVKLLLAGLKGLHQTAGLNLPATFATELKKADESDNRLVDAITRARQRMGNRPAFQNAGAMEIALGAVIKELDPYCFLSKDINSRYYIYPNNNQVGVDLDSAGIGPLRVKNVVPGGSGQRAGLRPGDQIIELDGEKLERKAGAESDALWQRLLRTKAFKIAFLRSGIQKHRVITLRPQSFQPETVFGVDRHDNQSWNYFVDRKHKIAHIRLGSLNSGTADELEKVLTQLQTDGLRGLILDLRWCPGGLLNEAVDVACLFVGNKTIASIDYRDGRKQKCTRGMYTRDGLSRAAISFLDFPMVVMVNGETIGGGELIAAAIQDYKRGAVAGQRTVGKGSVQNTLMADQNNTVFYPAANLSVRLSIGVFTRATGKNLQRFATSTEKDDWGVRPNDKLHFPVSKALSQRLREQWLWQTLRPADSKEFLPLDDPDKDPQRQFALKSLLRILKENKNMKKAVAEK